MSHKYNNLTTVDDIYYLSNEMKIDLKCFYTYPELFNYLNKYKPKNINIIYNIINKSDRPGHWICIKIINNYVYIFTCFGVIYRPLNEMFYRLGYYNIIYIMDQKQKLNSDSCGYYCLLFIKSFNQNKLNDYNYIYYKKIIKDNDYEIKKIYHFNDDFDIKKYIKYQKILLDINK